MSENLAEQVIRPSYEQIVVGSIRHSGVQEILRRAQEDEWRMDRELAAKLMDVQPEGAA